MPEGDESVQVWLANPLGGATLGSQAAATLTIMDDDTAVELAAATLSVIENAGGLPVIVRRLGATNIAFTVHITTGDGTARAGTDYLAQDLTLTFAPGEIQKTNTITILDDAWGEPDKTFQVILSNPSNGVLLGQNAQATVIILDNDRPGSVDTSLHSGAKPLTFSVSGLSGPSTLALQPNGQIVVGGNFPTFSLLRVFPDGTLDPNFMPTLFSPFFGPPAVAAVTIQPPEAKIVAAGQFTANCTNCVNLARFNSDGSVDQTFSPPVPQGSGPIWDVVSAPDGSHLILGGQFWYSWMEGTNQEVLASVARLNADGSLDTNFNPGQVIQGYALAVGLQADGKVVVGGAFETEVSRTRRAGIARLNRDGSLDAAFNPGLGVAMDSFPGGSVSTLALQPDGRILIGGFFTIFNGTPRPSLARLQANGGLDTAFVPGILPLGSDNPAIVRAILWQPDGKILAGGRFRVSTLAEPVGLVRLNPDGSLDRWFDPGRFVPLLGDFGQEVMALALQPDGQVLAAGGFWGLNSVLRPGLIRINGGEPLVFTSIGLLADGHVRLLTSIPRDATYVLQASSNLAQWVSLRTNSVPAGTFEWFDDQAPQFRQRFYRLQPLSPGP